MRLRLAGTAGYLLAQSPFILIICSFLFALREETSFESTQNQLSDSQSGHGRGGRRRRPGPARPCRGHVGQCSQHSAAHSGFVIGSTRGNGQSVNTEVWSWTITLEGSNANTPFPNTCFSSHRSFSVSSCITRGFAVMISESFTLALSTAVRPSVTSAQQLR